MGRWDIDAEQMQRTVYEVTKMSSKVKAILNRQVTNSEECELEPVKVILFCESKVLTSVGHSWECL